MFVGFEKESLCRFFFLSHNLHISHESWESVLCSVSHQKDVLFPYVSTYSDLSFTVH